ncbi:MAG: hypothetical protein ABW170_09370 [Candidatus Thiodiazotropha sp. L084R]
MDLKPGKHTITFDYDGNEGALGLGIIKSQIESAGPLTINIENNMQYYLRFNHPGWVSIGYGAKIVNKEIAIDEIKDLQYNGIKK